MRPYLQQLVYSLLLALVASTAPILTTSAQEAQKSLLYKVSGKGLEKPSYVFGTIHIMCQEDFFMPKALQEALKESDKLVLELDYSDQKSMSQAQMKAVMAPNQPNLGTLMSDEDSAMVDDFLIANYGIGLQAFGTMKPIATFALVIDKSLPCKKAAFEMELTKLAKADSLEMGGLEEVAFQMSLFDAVPIEEVIGWIIEGVKEIKAGDTESMDELMAAYKGQDIEQLHDMIMSEERMANYADRMVYDRNADWIPKMKAEMENMPTVFAVGAGHLGSEKGVINLLGEAGYTVEAVPLEE